MEVGPEVGLKSSSSSSKRIEGPRNLGKFPRTYLSPLNWSIYRFGELKVEVLAMTDSGSSELGMGIWLFSKVWSQRRRFRKKRIIEIKY